MKALLYIVILGIIIYLSISFVTLKLDYRDWTEGVRFMALLLYIKNTGSKIAFDD